MTSADTVERLRSVATATLIASLMKRGIRNAVLRRVLPLSPSTRKCVGPAFTMRNLPMREDKGHANVLADPNYPQRQMLESAPVGSVVVMDCHGEAGSAMAGDLMVARMKVRGIEALVGDGGMRDAVETASLGFPVYCAGVTPYPSTNQFLAHELQCPIACGGVAVYPGDIVVGDGDGIVILPQEIADEVSRECAEQELLETFCRMKLEEGRAMPGTYPPNDVTRREFEEWRSRQPK